MPASKLERLLNLTALLLDAARPVPAEEVHRAVPGYPEDLSSFRRAFERDKDELRSMGIPLVVERVHDRSVPVDGYRIPKDDYYLRDPGLEGDELAALHLAASAVQVEGLPALEGLHKLGGAVGRPEGGTAFEIGALPSDPNLPVLFAAVAEQRSVVLAYRGEQRRIDPHRLEYQRGHWYLSGFDHLRGEQRAYRLDRIEGDVERTDDEPFDAPEPVTPGAAFEPWLLGEGEPTPARLRIDAPQAAWALQHVGPDRVVETGDDGSIVVELPVTNRAAFRSFVLSFLDRAEVLAPPDLRDEVVEWLEAMTGRTR